MPDNYMKYIQRHYIRGKQTKTHNAAGKGKRELGGRATARADHSDTGTWPIARTSAS